MRENQTNSDIVQKVDGIGLSSRKRKRRNSVSPLARLIRDCPGGRATTNPLKRVENEYAERDGTARTDGDG